MMRKKLLLMGFSGSIGKQTLDLLKEDDEYEEKIGNEGKVKVIKEESRKKLLEKTREGKRAFINNESVHDITVPLAALLR